MQKLRDRLRTAPRLAFTLVTLALLAVSATPPLVSAAGTEDYTAAEIEQWLEDTITGTTVAVTASPSVTLSDTEHQMEILDMVVEVRGVSVGLSFLRLTFDGSTTVDIAGELDVLGKLPHFWCTAQMECLGSEQKLHFTALSDVKVANFTPSLSSGDLDTITDVLNRALDASGLSVSSPGGDLTGIDVVLDGGTAKLQTTWTGAGPAYLETSELDSKLSGMADTLAGKATDYLAAGEGDWNVVVVVDSDKESLEIDASCSAFGIAAELSDFNVLFDGLTATVTDATLSVGTATKTFTFSVEGEVGCDAGVPSVTMVDLTVGDEYTGFRDFIADNEVALLHAIEQTVDAIVEDTGLEFPFCPYSITVEGGTVLLHEGTGLVEGDANLDGRTNIIDAMFVAQYVVGIREFDDDQMLAADTTDEGAVNIIDAMHIAQFTVDPHATANVLFKLLWQSPEDDGMIDPLTV